MLAFYLDLIETQEDKIKFSDIYYKYRGFVQAVVRGVTGNEELSKDAEQEAFEKIIKYLGRIDDVESSQTKVFIAVMAKSAARDLMRRERKYLEAECYEERLNVAKDFSLETEIIQNELALMTTGAVLPNGNWSYGIDISHHQPLVRWKKLRILIDEDGNVLEDVIKDARYIVDNQYADFKFKNTYDSGRYTVKLKKVRLVRNYLMIIKESLLPVM